MPVAAPVAIGLSALGTAISAIGQISAAHAQAQNASYQAQVARNNQIVANQNAAYAAQAGQAQVTQAQLKQRAEVGEVGAALAANGIDINTGSPAAVRSAEAGTTQLNTETTAQNAALQVYGFKTQATGFGAQAGLYRNEARQAPIAGAIGATGTLLSGAGSLASKWSAWQNPATSASAVAAP